MTSDSDDADKDNKPAHKKSPKKVVATPKQGQPKKPEGLNWTAVIILLIMIVPMLLTVGIQALDYLYPDAAMTRTLRARILKCYQVANPEKIDSIDSTLKKFKGKEHILFAKLKGKYERYPECQY